MPMLDRAAQFAPFAALTGYEAAVGETARLTSERRELDAQAGWIDRSCDHADLWQEILQAPGSTHTIYSIFSAPSGSSKNSGGETKTFFAAG